MRTWLILSGEYPPAMGGVSDYTRLVACALARSGDSIHVVAPLVTGDVATDPGVTVHRLHGGFGPRGFWQLSQFLSPLPEPCRLLVQYVPHAFGLKGMNLPFCLWLRSRKGVNIDVMFHEVTYPRHGPRRRDRILSFVQRKMARLATEAADRIFVSTTAWEPLLRSIGEGRPVLHLPIPSNLPTHAHPSAVLTARAHLHLAASKIVIGHFGTFGEPVAGMLNEVLSQLLRTRVDCTVVLLGRGSRQFSATLLRAWPAWANRVVAEEGLPAAEVATYLSACDLVIQPFPDGVTTRRTSLMAGLALGIPVISNSGILTEPLWQRADAIGLASSVSGMIELVERLAKSPEQRRELGARGVALYRRSFSVERTVAALRDFAETT